MNVLVNGKNVTIDAPKVTIALLMSHLNISSEGVAVAIGTSVIAQSKWNEYYLDEGSKVTLIRATQGG